MKRIEFHIRFIPHHDKQRLAARLTSARSEHGGNLFRHSRNELRHCLRQGDAHNARQDNDRAMKTYQAPWGSALISISCLLAVLSVASVAGIPLILGSGPPGMLLMARWTLPVIVLSCLPFMIRSYAITDDAILIRRLFWTTRLDRGGLESAESVPKAMKNSLRICGNGGGFSFTGGYWSKSLGFYRAFVTDLERTVVLRFRNRTVVVSPHNPDDFVRELKLR